MTWHMLEIGAVDMSKIDMTGLQAGKLTVIEKSGVYHGHDTMWRCLCKCGNERVVRGSYLRNGHTKSCGNCQTISDEGFYLKCRKIAITN